VIDRHVDAAAPADHSDGCLLGLMARGASTSAWLRRAGRDGRGLKGFVVVMGVAGRGQRAVYRGQRAV
jgi:hypothetical protein